MKTISFLSCLDAPVAVQLKLAALKDFVEVIPQLEGGDGCEALVKLERLQGSVRALEAYLAREGVTAWAMPADESALTRVQIGASL